MFQNSKRAIPGWVAVACLLIAQPAWAVFCTGKQNGLWCDGDNLVNCKNGSQASSQTCSNGCQSNPPGVADACKGGGFCGGKQNGLWCNGSDLVNCQGGNISSSQNCSAGCQSNPPGVADACKSSGPCSGKQDGAWCNGNDLMQCKGGNVASSQGCANGCQSNPVGTSDVCKPPPSTNNFCTGKADGPWCDGNALKLCKGGNVGSSQDCANGCQSNPSGTPDACKTSGGATNFCTGKSDGAWCDGNSLKQCKSGNVASSQDCKNGCQQNGSGVADACKPDPIASNFCTGKAPGAYCDGEALKTCKNDNVAGETVCKAGCQGNAAGTDDACKPEGPVPTGFCAGKADGPWCNGNSLAACAGGWVVGSQGCPLGCQNNAGGKPDACKVQGDPVEPGGPAAANDAFCQGKQNGAWCDGDKLATCNGGAVAAAMSCALGCQSNGAGVADVCKSPADAGGCSGQLDGQWCVDGALLQCAGGKQQSAMKCANGCQALGGVGKASCGWKTSGFCTAKADGVWCDGGLLTTCQAGAVKSAFPCPKGCLTMPAGVADQCKPQPPAGGAPAGNGALSVTEQNGCAVFSGNVDLWAGKGLQAYDQKAYSDQLGTCPGLTIHSSGCTISSLSMMHALLGLDRTVGGKSGHTPDIENAWRKANNGYAHTKYDGVEGDCLVIWGKTAGGLVPAPHHNDSSSCISVAAAKVIAQSLNAGSPVLAGVHWPGSSSSENSHWVLIVGADSEGVILNDPWGGKPQIRLNQGALGKYVVDTLYTFFFSAGGGNFEMAAVDDKGDAVPEAALPNSMENIKPDVATPAGQDGGSTSLDGSLSGLDGGAAGGGITPKSAGCTAGPRSAALPWLFLVVCAVSWLRRRRPA